MGRDPLVGKHWCRRYSLTTCSLTTSTDVDDTVWLHTVWLHACLVFLAIIVYAAFVEEHECGERQFVNRPVSAEYPGKTPTIYATYHQLSAKPPKYLFVSSGRPCYLHRMLNVIPASWTSSTTCDGKVSCNSQEAFVNEVVMYSELKKTWSC